MSTTDRVLNVVLVAAAVLMAGVVIRREVAPAQGPVVIDRPDAPPRFVEAWREKILPHSIPLGDSTRPVQIVEFADFECPYCRKFDSTMHQIELAYPGKVSRYFIHFPLSAIHRFAMPAALAADCAGKQGKVAAMHDALFAKQDSFGLRPWKSYARDAGISDTSAFADCIALRNRAQLIVDGLETGKRWQVEATPTVIVNGWRFIHPPRDSTLRETIVALLSGKRPPIADTKAGTN